MLVIPLQQLIECPDSISPKNHDITLDGLRSAGPDLAPRPPVRPNLDSSGSSKSETVQCCCGLHVSQPMLP
ncbi:hypothetical protein RRG08_067402 [Elysia crispata]|uniref:Uncharacterized protein n=1 Tax=Elysia crispata TaxID=231223 RepID=A0AAE1CUQ3_9GAST|nr:hypothetical protein RRG08_067402 [Elysia crispata]